MSMAWQSRGKPVKTLDSDPGMATCARRQVVLDAIQFRRPTYVPWHIRLTSDCAARLRQHLGTDDLESFLDNHMFDVRFKLRTFEPVDATHVRDRYGVTWDRSIDKDIGTPSAWPLQSPDGLNHYRLPDANDDALYQGLTEQVALHRELFTRYSLAMCLFERAWALRGMENLLLDMLERPRIFERLLDAIVEHHLIVVHKALALGIDCIHFGDDYGMQTGLILGAPNWRKYIKPRLARLFAPVRAAGTLISLHSCGKVQGIFDDLVEIGLNFFNPFQPEVMDVFHELRRQRGKLAFHGGLSIQRTLPFGSPAEVREQTHRLLEAGREGGYIFAPAHDVPPDVPPENIVTMVEALQSQPGFVMSSR
jgi:uroporphyrinogen decarboxylase